MTSWTRPGFEALLSERGISNDDTVVLYGGNNNWFAAYAYWYFKLYGHDNVLLLDGGRKKWELDSRELATDVPPARRGPATRAQEQDASLRALRDEVDRRHRQAQPGRRPLARRVRRPAARPGAPAAGAGAARRAHPDRAQRPVVQGGERGRHLQVRRRAARAVRRRGRGLRQGHHRLLPDRRALGAHLVRAARAARPAQRQELRRLMDRVRLAGRRADRAGRRHDERTTAAERLRAGSRSTAARRGQARPSSRAASPRAACRRCHRLRPAARQRRRVRRRGARSARTAASASSPRPATWTLLVLAPGGVREERVVPAAIGTVTKVDVAV